jgi:putative transposase
VRTIARILERAGEVVPRRRTPPRSRPGEAPQADVEKPGDLWTVDFKGWWNANDGARCEPLTVRDAASRFVLCARLMNDTSGEAVQVVFAQLFKGHGLPRAIQVDNGPPLWRWGTTTGSSRRSASSRRALFDALDAAVVGSLCDESRFDAIPLDVPVPARSSRLR